MAIGSKIFRKAAMFLEKGRDAAVTTMSTGWGKTQLARGLATADNTIAPVTGVVSEQTALGGATYSCFPWLDFDFKPKINTKQDESVTSNAYKSVARVTGKLIDGAKMSFNHRFDGIGRFLYMMFGWQSAPLKVIVIEGVLTGTPVANTTVFSDTTAVTPKTYKYIRTETSRGVAHHVFSPTGATVGAPAVGTFTATTPACAITGGVTAANCSPVLIECVYELDNGIRNLRKYTANEKAALVAMGVPGATVDTWRKNPYATIGQKVTDYDLIYKNVLASGFTIDSNNADATVFSVDCVGYDETRVPCSDANGSDNWVLPVAMQDNMNVPFAHQTDLYIAATGSGVQDTSTFLGASKVSLKTTLAMNLTQDMVSGLSLAEPVMEEKIDITMSATLSRHSATTFMDFRDGLVGGSQTPVCARWYMRQGFLSNEILVKKATIIDAGPNNDATTGEDLALSVGWVNDVGSTDNSLNPWYTYLGGGFHANTLTSPTVMRVRSTENINWMVAV